MFMAIKLIFMGPWLQNQTNVDRVKGLKVNMIKCTQAVNRNKKVAKKVVNVICRKQIQAGEGGQATQTSALKTHIKIQQPSQ